MCKRVEFNIKEHSAKTKFQKVVELYSDKAKGHALFFTRSSW